MGKTASEGSDELLTVVLLHGIGGRKSPDKWLKEVWKVLGDPDQLERLSDSCDIVLAGTLVHFRNTKYRKLLRSNGRREARTNLKLGEVPVRPTAVAVERYEFAKADLAAHLNRHTGTKIGRRLPPKLIERGARAARNRIPFFNLP